MHFLLKSVMSCHYLNIWACLTTVRVAETRTDEGMGDHFLPGSLCAVTLQEHQMARDSFQNTGDVPEVVLSEWGLCCPEVSFILQEYDHQKDDVKG